MREKLITVSLLAGMLATSAPAIAAAPRVSMTLATPGASRTLTLPEAAGNSPVIALGAATDPQSGNLVEGFAIVRYRDTDAKPDGGGAGNGHGGGGKPTSSCYGFLASGAKWKAVEPWVMNPANIDALDAAFAFSNMAGNVAKWESAAGADVLGAGSSTSDLLAADTTAPDGVNEVYFGAIADPGVIGVTIVWGIFGGPPRNRELVEWDQVYDDVDFDWASDGSASAMDFENIATHELGHTFGLADLYTGECAEETMYGYAAEGETNKRDLATGDIAGISSLY